MANLETDENVEVIASNKVEGTDVFDVDGQRIGSIYNVMINKFSGQVEYAAVQFGGMLGLGSDYFPVPWAALEYDEDKEGYVLDMDVEALKQAPRFAAGQQPLFSPEYAREIDELYGIQYDDEEAEDDDGAHADYSSSGRSLLEAGEECIRRNPVWTLGGSFALGWLIGRRL